MPDPTRLFTLESANAFVPRLSEIFATVRVDLEAAREVMADLERSGHPVQPDETVDEDPDAPPEVRALQRTLRDIAERIAIALEEVGGLGIEVKAADGLVDFRSRRDGDVVYLCWRYGESRISHWHDLDSGFAGRRPIDDPDAFEGDYLQ